MTRYLWSCFSLLSSIALATACGDSGASSSGSAGSGGTGNGGSGGNSSTSTGGTGQGTATGTGGMGTGGMGTGGSGFQKPPVTPYIVVDQFGYRPISKKIAVARDPQTGFDAAESFTPGGTYALVNASTGQKVFEAPPSAWKG